MGRGGFMWENVRYFDEEGGRGRGEWDGDWRRT